MRISHLISLVFIVLICTVCNTYADPDLPLEISEKYYKKEAILKFNDAVKKWEAKSTNEAISQWKEALNIDPTLWIAYLGLGQAYDSQKEYKNSLEAYNQYLKLAPKNAPDRQSVTESVKYLSHLLRNGEEAVTGEDYLPIVKTKHQGKEHYVRWDISSPLKLYFYPAAHVPGYRNEFQRAFLEGAMIWQEVLPDLKLEVINNSVLLILKGEDKDKKEKELVEQAQIKIIFPSRFKVKGDPNNPIASQIDAQSFPIIRDKKNFRVLGVIMISPFVYYQSQIAIPLEPLSKLKPDDQIKKLKIIAAREIGHVLGLWGFSPNPDDLMFEGEVKELRLSERDKNTMRKLYELNPEKDEVVTNQ
ncbi:MAG: hypothetical protein HY094_10280 [Candidatus Melainabacteria bacterium]|nr:hypothetical protein [Candidatus Melainabacteria bacterium]